MTKAEAELLVVTEAVKNGAPLSGLTNGEVLMKMFPYAEIEIHGDTVYVVLRQYHRQCFDLDWWNTKWGE